MQTTTTPAGALTADTRLVPHVVFVEMSVTGTGERCIDYARRRGYAVTVATRDPAPYAHLLDDTIEVVVCDTLDEDALVVSMRELNARRAVDAVTTTHDLFVPAAAVAAHALGLPGMSPVAAHGVRSKYLMRQRLAERLPHVNPPFRLVCTEEEALAAAAEWGYPVIGKPQNANDSWNVERLDTPADVAAYMHAAASWGDAFKDARLLPGVLLEGYVEGDEYSIETSRLPGGPIEFMGGTRKVLLGENRFTEVGISFPVTGPVVELLRREVAATLLALEVSGIAHTEVRVRDGNVTVLEVNARLPGAGTGSHMIELGTGADPAEQLVEKALGRPSPFVPMRQQGVGKFAVLMPRSGAFGGITNVDELRAMPGVTHVRTCVREGTFCAFPPLSNDDFVAHVIAVAPTPDEALELARTAAAAASVRVLASSPPTEA